VQQFARRKPGTFLLIAAAAGFVVGRLGRAAVAASQDDSSSGASRLAGPDAYPEGDGVYRSATATGGYPGGYAGGGYPESTTGTAAYPDTAATGYPATGYPGTGEPAAPPVPPAGGTAAYPSTYDADQAGVVPPVEPYPSERPR
jgi:hypothetical protein